MTGKLFTSKSDTIPFGAFYVLIEGNAGPNPERERLEQRYYAGGDGGDMFIAAGIMIRELKRGKNVFFVIHPDDDLKDYGLEAIARAIADEGEE